MVPGQTGQWIEIPDELSILRSQHPETLHGIEHTSTIGNNHIFLYCYTNLSLVKVNFIFNYLFCLNLQLF